MKILPSLLVISILVLSGSQAFGQQLSMGQNPTERISITIDENGTAHVTHSVKGPSSSPVQVDMINGNISNLFVTDVNGRSVEYGSIQKSPISIILNTLQRNMTLIKYDLVNVVLNKDGIWKWNYYEPQDIDFTAFHFPKGVDMVWANNRPVYLGDRGLGQHGNGFTLEYVINEPVNTQNVQLGDKNFIVEVRTVSGLGDYVFDQSLKSYSLNVDKAEVPVTVIIPQYLLGGPYDVKLNGNVTLHQEFHKNGTHSWIGLEPTKSGTIQIIGTTTGQEPQANIDSGQNFNSGTVVGSGQVSGSSQSSTSSDNTIIAILIAVIIAAVVVGVIIIKKRNSKV